MVLTLLPSAPEWKPWETEPDSAAGTIEGYDVVILRIPEALHLCGYVDVPLSHPAALVDWDDWEKRPSFSVHGGVTYHREKDDFFRIGFDCAHLGDFSPGLNSRRDGIYRDMEYVRAEVESLARQLSIFASIDEALRGI